MISLEACFLCVYRLSVTYNKPWELEGFRTGEIKIRIIWGLVRVWVSFLTFYEMNITEPAGARGKVLNTANPVKPKQVVYKT